MTAKVSSVQGSCLYQSNATYLYIYIYIIEYEYMPQKVCNIFIQLLKFHEQIESNEGPQGMRPWKSYPRNGCTSIQPIVVPEGMTWPRCVERLQDMDGNGSSMVQHRAANMDVVQNEEPHVISYRLCVCVIKKEFKVEDTIYSYRLITTTWKKYLWSKVPLSVYDHWRWSNPSASVGWNVNQTFAQCSPRKDDRKLQHQRAQTMLSSNMQQLQSLKLVIFFGVVCLKYRPKGGER